MPSEGPDLAGSRKCWKIEKKLENVGFPDVIMSIQSIHCDSSDSSDSVTAAVDVWLRRDGGAS